MIRHLVELGAWFLCFAVGVGLLAALGIGLLLIWSKRPAEDSTLEDEYRRVEGRGAFNAPVQPHEAMASLEPHPYNWATREPMVWVTPQ